MTLQWPRPLGKGKKRTLSSCDPHPQHQCLTPLWVEQLHHLSILHIFVYFLWILVLTLCQYLGSLLHCGRPGHATIMSVKLLEVLIWFGQKWIMSSSHNMLLSSKSFLVLNTTKVRFLQHELYSSVLVLSATTVWRSWQDFTFTWNLASFQSLPSEQYHRQGVCRCRCFFKWQWQQQWWWWCQWLQWVTWELNNHWNQQQIGISTYPIWDISGISDDEGDILDNSDVSDQYTGPRCSFCDEPLNFTPSDTLVSMCNMLQSQSRPDPIPINPDHCKASFVITIEYCQRHCVEGRILPHAQSKGWVTNINFSKLFSHVIALKSSLCTLLLVDNTKNNEFYKAVQKSYDPGTSTTVASSAGGQYAVFKGH